MVSGTATFSTLRPAAAQVTFVGPLSGTRNGNQLSLTYVATFGTVLAGSCALSGFATATIVDGTLTGTLSVNTGSCEPWASTAHQHGADPDEAVGLSASAGGASVSADRRPSGRRLHGLRRIAALPELDGKEGQALQHLRLAVPVVVPDGADQQLSSPAPSRQRTAVRQERIHMRTRAIARLTYRRARDCRPGFSAAKPENVAQLEQKLRQVVAEARQLSGCLRYDWYRSPDAEHEKFCTRSSTPTKRSRSTARGRCQGIGEQLIRSWKGGRRSSTSARPCWSKASRYRRWAVAYRVLALK